MSSPCYKTLEWSGKLLKHSFPTCASCSHNLFANYLELPGHWQFHILETKKLSSICSTSTSVVCVHTNRQTQCFCGFFSFFYGLTWHNVQCSMDIHVHWNKIHLETIWALALNFCVNSGFLITSFLDRFCGKKLPFFDFMVIVICRFSHF